MTVAVVVVVVANSNGSLVSNCSMMEYSMESVQELFVEFVLDDSMTMNFLLIHRYKKKSKLNSSMKIFVFIDLTYRRDFS